MNEIDQLLKALREVNRDIEGMLRSGAKDEKSLKVLTEAREYRQMLEEEIMLAVKKAEADEPAIIGVIIINLD